MNEKEIIRRELIGLNIKVVNAKNKANIGIEGKIVDETKNTIMVKLNKKKKRLLKKQITIEIENKIRAEGKLFLGRPEDRIKKRLR